MTNTLKQVLVDLDREGDRLADLVTSLTGDAWSTPTPAAGWDVATQIAHLAWTDEVALKAATSKAEWDAVVLEAIEDPAGFVDACALSVARDPDLLARWGRARRGLREALAVYPNGEKMPWFGPPMSPTSMATARLMETWAHSLDVHEALGVPSEDTDRIRHIAHLGVRTRNFAFGVHGLQAPTEEFRIDLVAPSGDVWSWGPEAAPQSVTGSASDFCRLVTQRINRADTSLVATGDDADRWLDIAQCFAGPAGGGRPPR